MLKKTFLTLTLTGIIGLLSAGFSSSAFALSFTDFVDFGAGEIYKRVNENDSVANRSWTHNILDNIGGFSINNITITSATLSLRYSSTNSGTEIWSLNFNMGNLLVAGTTPVTTAFNLTPSALSDLQADGIITFTISETMSPGVTSLGGVSANWVNGDDTVRLYDSTLTGQYEPKVNPSSAAVPEPGTMALVGMGLTGLGIFSRRKAKLEKKL